MTSPDTEFIDIMGPSEGGSDTTITRAGGKSLPSELPILGLSDVVVVESGGTVLVTSRSASQRVGELAEG